MSNINSLTKFKQAKMLKQDLEEIIPIIVNSIKQLNRYKDRYSLVRQSISNLDDLKTILEIHKGNVNKIIENKAIIGDNKKTDEHS